MQYPNYSANQFINATAMNTGQGFINKGAKDLLSGLFSPGLLSPSEMVISYNGNLVVSLSMPYPLGSLFQDGTVANAHGTTNGLDSQSQDVDFSSLIPGSGSVTAYCLMALTSVKQNPYVVVGPPPGHPDYSPSFSPYIAYFGVQDTLSIYPSLSAPNNTTIFELFRTTLSAGQTVISTTDITNQVAAAPKSTGLLNITQINGFFNRAWHDVKSSRSIGTWYQNTNSYPTDIKVVERIYNTTSVYIASAAEIHISSYLPNSNPYVVHSDFQIIPPSDAIIHTVSATIPPGNNYRFYFNNPIGGYGTIWSWYELY